MKIAFISLVEDVSTPNLRNLSAYLRAKGFDTVLILLPWQFTDGALNQSNSYLYPYPDRILKQVAEICNRADLIGISVMTCHFDNAVYVTRFLRRACGKPIIWGGIHPTLRPLECLEYADMVCVGEGEISLYQMATEMSQGRSRESSTIQGIYKRHDRRPFLPGPIIHNLDDLPLPDYDMEHQFILYNGNVIRLDSTLLERCFPFYTTLFSRGCPYACAYCCNNAIHKLYGHLKLRWRSVDNMIKELKAAINLMPHLKGVLLGDDSFLTQPTERIEDFAKRYRDEIGLPLEVLSIPRSVSEYKLRLLFQAGLTKIGIGIQSGSKRIRRGLYHRPESLKDLFSADECIKRVATEMKQQITVRYDLILDNPWEDEQDIEASIRLAIRLLTSNYNRIHCELDLFSLTFYPGTDLYEKARREGIITDDLNQVYRHSQLVPNRTYLNSILTLLNSDAPKWIVNFFLGKTIRRLSPVWLPYSFAVLLRAPSLFRKSLSYAKEREWRRILSLIAYSEYITGHPMRVVKRSKFCGAPGEFCVSPEDKKYEGQR